MLFRHKYINLTQPIKSPSVRSQVLLFFPGVRNTGTLFTYSVYRVFFPFYPEVPMPQLTSSSLPLFVHCLNQVPDPRSKHGVYHPFRTILALVFLGLLGNVTTLADIERWTKLYFPQLKKFLRFRQKKKKWQIPHAITFARVLRGLSLNDLQTAFAEFVNAILADTTLVAAVDGNTAKQMKDEEGNPILMLNVFAQTLKLHLASWSVDGDKTNEPGCLKKHLAELFEMYPCLKLLTGDAIFAQRPLLEAIQEHHRDYLFQVKDNQPKVLEKLEETFKDAPKQETKNSPTHDRQVDKKRGLVRFAVSG